MVELYSTGPGVLAAFCYDSDSDRCRWWNRKTLGVQTSSRLLRSKGEGTLKADRRNSGTPFKPSALRRFISKVTGAPSHYDPDDDPMLDKLKDIEKKLQRSQPHDPGRILGEAIVPRR